MNHSTFRSLHIKWNTVETENVTNVKPLQQAATELKCDTLWTLENLVLKQRLNKHHLELEKSVASWLFVVSTLMHVSNY